MSCPEVSPSALKARKVEWCRVVRKMKESHIKENVPQEHPWQRDLTKAKGLKIAGVDLSFYKNDPTKAIATMVVVRQNR